jgi:hypothetical protein
MQIAASLFIALSGAMAAFWLGRFMPCRLAYFLHGSWLLGPLFGLVTCLISSRLRQEVSSIEYLLLFCLPLGGAWLVHEEWSGILCSEQFRRVMESSLVSKRWGGPTAQRWLRRNHRR